MRRSFLVLVLVLLISLAAAGCAAHSPNDVSDDLVQIMPDRGSSGDFLVLFLNRQTLLVNGDLASDRQNVTASRLKEIGCREPRELRERAEPREGSWAFGRKRVVYYSEWACS